MSRTRRREMVDREHLLGRTETCRVPGQNITIATRLKKRSGPLLGAVGVT